mmetsp:Transcript_84592/g.215345  ORF Transcript_84592/g.215345 Transcript_84592/m.215345 type:complete len:208 (+) Transcript_84592:137-760(+)
MLHSIVVRNCIRYVLPNHVNVGIANGLDGEQRRQPLMRRQRHSPSSGLPQQLCSLLVCAEEDEATDGNPRHTRSKTLEQSCGALVFQDDAQCLVGAHVSPRLALHGALKHDPRLRHVQGRGRGARDGAGHGAASGALHGVRVVALPLFPRLLECLVDGELDEGEGDLAGDRGAVARVEAHQATPPVRGGDRLGERGIAADLHVLGED